MTIKIKTVCICEHQYNIASMSAVDQFFVMQKLGCVLALASKGDVNTIVGGLMSAKYDVVVECAHKLLYKTVKSGGSNVVTIADFQDSITGYYLLLADAILHNFTDFFLFLQKETSKQHVAPKNWT